MHATGKKTISETKTEKAQLKTQKACQGDGMATSDGKRQI
jgi:hypothetical protein